MVKRDSCFLDGTCRALNQLFGRADSTPHHLSPLREKPRCPHHRADAQRLAGPPHHSRYASTPHSARLGPTRPDSRSEPFASTTERNPPLPPTVAARRSDLAIPRALRVRGRKIEEYFERTRILFLPFLEDARIIITIYDQLSLILPVSKIKLKRVKCEKKREEKTKKKKGKNARALLLHTISIYVERARRRRGS